MNSISSYVVANAYSAFSPMANLASTCRVNGEAVACPAWLDSFALLFFSAFYIAGLVFVILVIASLWIVFKKAGKPGWAAIIPIYNLIVMLEIAHKPTWWVFGIFIPFVNIITSILVTYEFAKAFGKDVGFTIGLMVLPFIFYPILAFGKSTYVYSESSSPITPSPVV